ncbi:hypothetical protein BOX15_Mlig015307g1 [Macrostomum lignano]|uniref:Uncharacterized protein n=1 Tax=Macrostomum lignano TaxID=282301 RepID=A0A267EV41_9PLAT|nr:hypothetical protein BOX15_Mlig015307g1 [Macrostomum lignano]
MSTEELAWISAESNRRYLEELSKEFPDKIESEEILDIPDDVIEDLNERDGIRDSSVRQMEDNINRF